MNETFEWKPGVWYKMRSGEKALFIGKTTQNRLVFESEFGSVFTRKASGGYGISDQESPLDVIPIEHREPHRHECEIWISTVEKGLSYDSSLERHIFGLKITNYHFKPNHPDCPRKFKVVVEEQLE